MAKTRATEVKNVLKGEITFESLQQAKEVYKTISQESYQSGKWTQFNLAMAFLNQAFFELLKKLKEEDKIKEYMKYVFVDENGSYTASISMINQETGELDNLISVKFRNDSKIETLVDDYEFRIQN